MKMYTLFILVFPFFSVNSVFSGENNEKKLVIRCEGEVKDKNGYVVEDQTLLSISRMSDSTKKDAVLVRLKAVSITAKKTILEPIIILPELIYPSVEHVAQSIIMMKEAKDKKKFLSAQKKYKQALKEVSDLVSIHGYEIIEDQYDFKGGEVVKI